MEGSFREFSDGKVVKDLHYKADKPDGEWKEYDEDGKPIEIEHYKMGKKDGKQWYMRYYDRRSGIKQYITEYYKEDVPIGKWETKLEDGTLRERQEYKPNGTSVRERYHENGKLRELATFKGDKRHGPYKLYDDLGVLLEDSNYENNYPAHLKTFYPNGQVKEESFSKNGKREGKYILYDERGRTLLKGNYLKDYEDGLWQYYSLKGNLEKEINFKEGILEGTYKEYHLSGNPYILGSTSTQKEKLCRRLPTKMAIRCR